jgi:hypothetical protein
VYKDDNTSEGNGDLCYCDKFIAYEQNDIIATLWSEMKLKEKKDLFYNTWKALFSGSTFFGFLRLLKSFFYI